MGVIHPMYRARRGLDDASIELLAAGRDAILGTVGDDGWVHLTPVLYLFEDGRVYVETSSASRKARNVRARGRATVLVQDHRVDGTAWVSGSGPAALLSGRPAHELGRRIRARYLSERGEEQVGRIMAMYDDVVVAVAPERWLAWDMTAFNATLVEHGLSLDDAGSWYAKAASLADAASP